MDEPSYTTVPHGPLDGGNQEGAREQTWRRAKRDGPRSVRNATSALNFDLAPHSSLGGVKSASQSCELTPSRVEVHITRRPSGLKTGSTSAPGKYVSRVFLPVSRSIQ